MSLSSQVDDAVSKGMAEMSSKFAEIGEVYAKEEVLVEKAQRAE